MEQKAVLYQSSHDWWFYKTIHEEVFDNHDNFPATWNFSEKITSESKASWTLVKALKSSKVLPMNIILEYPVAKYGHQPLKVEFDCTKLSPAHKVLQTSNMNQFNMSEDITIDSYNSSKVIAQLQVCQLNDVMFATDIMMSGSIKVQGHKKNKKWTKHELTASVVDALAAKKALGFHVIENTTDMDAPARQIAFRVEGVCSGEVGVATRVVMQDIVTSV